MGTTHRALDWLARRHDGESAALIAWRAGVSEETVRRATRPYGPFPRATRHLGRTHLNAEVVGERTTRWVQARRRGMTVMEIARAEGVWHQYVSTCTAEYGPYPGPDVVQQWVAARAAGTSVAVVAEAAGVSAGVVRRGTRPFGPFRAKPSRMPEGVLGVSGLAGRVGMSHPAVLRWVRKGWVPDPDFVISSGRRLWLRSTIEIWLAGVDLAECPHCGARCVSLSQHRALAHRRSSS